MFFIDFEGNVADPRTADALDDLRSTALTSRSWAATRPPRRAVTRNPRYDSACSPADSARRSTLSCHLVLRPKRRELPARRTWSSADDTVIPVGNLLIAGRLPGDGGSVSVESEEQINATARVREPGRRFFVAACSSPHVAVRVSGLGWDDWSCLRPRRATGMPIIARSWRRPGGGWPRWWTSSRSAPAISDFDLLRELARSIVRSCSSAVSRAPSRWSELLNTSSPSAISK